MFQLGFFGSFFSFGLCQFAFGGCIDIRRHLLADRHWLSEVFLHFAQCLLIAFLLLFFRRTLLLGGFFVFGCFHPGLELINSASRIDKLLLTGVERMASRTELDPNFRGDGRAGFEFITAGTPDGCFFVFGMNFSFHCHTRVAQDFFCIKINLSVFCLDFRYQSGLELSLHKII